MKLRHCFFCNKLTFTPYHVTEIDHNLIHNFDMCKSCGQEFTADAYGLPASAPAPVAEVSQPPSAGEDLTDIKSPADLLSFIMGKKKKSPQFPPCQCGLTLEDFRQKGRFGCPHCYDHFSVVIERVVLPYHRATEHTGKVPKASRQRPSDPEEMLKLLKLQYAQAIELERYEKAAELHKQIQSLK